MHSTQAGKLHVLWREGQGPSVDRETLKRVYETIYLPTLARDIQRMHNVFEVCVRDDRNAPENPVGFNSYVGAVMRFKRTIGAMALASVDEMEARYTTLHNDFIAASHFENRAATCTCLGALAARSRTQIDVADATFTEARLACIGYDTSEALNDVANHMLGQAGMAELYIASLQGDAAMSHLLTRKWPAQRKNDDARMLAEKIYQLSTTLHTVERIRAVQDLNPDIVRPKVDTFKLVRS